MCNLIGKDSKYVWQINMFPLTLPSSGQHTWTVFLIEQGLKLIQLCISSDRSIDINLDFCKTAGLQSYGFGFPRQLWNRKKLICLGVKGP